jgi:stress-induced morphogen
MSVKKIIYQKISEKIRPAHLDVINESHMHSVPKNSETHFRVVIVADEFEKKSLVERHRIINGILANELKNGLHALAIVAKTPNEWALLANPGTSPKCRGGSKSNNIRFILTHFGCALSSSSNLFSFSSALKSS